MLSQGKIQCLSKTGFYTRRAYSQTSVTVIGPDWVSHAQRPVQWVRTTVAEYLHLRCGSGISGLTVDT